MEVKKWVMEARVPLGMLVVQVIATGLQILSRVILSEGTFVFAFLAYRNIIAAFSLLPFALYLERGVVRKLTLAAFFWLFMVAFTGISMALGLFYYALKDTTSTYSTNFLTIIPVITFLLSTILRVEKLEVKTRGGKTKSIGALLCLSGALTMALYEGKSVKLSHRRQPKSIEVMKHHWTRGTILLVGSCFSYALSYIFQVKLLKVFPHKYWATLLTCSLASIQAVAFGFCIDRKSKSWRLSWNLQLITIFYSGILASAATLYLVSMAIMEKGPTYPSMFNPLGLIAITITEALFLGQELYVGSLIGMPLIILGLYYFLWGVHLHLKATHENGGEGGGDSRVEAESSPPIEAGDICEAKSSPPTEEGGNDSGGGGDSQLVLVERYEGLQSATMDTIDVVIDYPKTDHPRD